MPSDAGCGAIDQAKEPSWHDFLSNSGTANPVFLMEEFPQYSAISGLTTLIKIHTKRFKHYNAAAIYARSGPLKMLFRKYAANSQECIKTLVRSLTLYGGTSYFPAEIRENTSLWSKIKGLFNTEEINVLLRKSEAIERYALRVHRKTLALSFIPPDTSGDIRNQIRRCEEAFDTIKMLREKGVNEILVAS